MKKLFFGLALLLPLVASASRPNAAPQSGIEIVGPSVLMNDARRREVQIIDLRQQGRRVPGATKNSSAPLKTGQPLYVLGELETAQQWAERRDVKDAQVVPPHMIEFEPMQGVPQLSPEAAREKEQQGWPLYDISEQVEFDEQRLPGSVRLDYSEFLKGNRQELPKQRPFIVACRVGHRSQLVVQKLRAAGYDAHNLCGGLWEWQCRNLPLEGGAS